MEFTLRQARNLESNLRDLEILNQVVQIRAYDEEVARNDIEKAVQELVFEVDDKIFLNEIRFFIKNSVNEANMRCGVSKLITLREEIYQRGSIINTLNESDDMERQITYIANNPSNSKLSCVVTESLVKEMDELREKDKKELADINQKLSELNNTVTITLEEDQVELLKDMGFL